MAGLAVGGVALVLAAVSGPPYLGAGVAVGVAGDFAGDSLAGSASLLLAGEGGLVLIAVGSILLSG